MTPARMEGAAAIAEICLRAAAQRIAEGHVAGVYVPDPARQWRARWQPDGGSVEVTIETGEALPVEAKADVCRRISQIGLDPLVCIHDGRTEWVMEIEPRRLVTSPANERRRPRYAALLRANRWCVVDLRHTLREVPCGSKREALVLADRLEQSLEDERR